VKEEGGKSLVTLAEEKKRKGKKKSLEKGKKKNAPSSP